MNNRSLRVILQLDFPGCPPEPVLSLPKGGHDVIPAKAGIQAVREVGNGLKTRLFPSRNYAQSSYLHTGVKGV
jgi:hypothetical protein